MDERIQLLESEIRGLRNDIADLTSHVDTSNVRKRKAEKIPCKGITGRGLQCGNNAIENSEYCKMHGERSQKPQKVRRVTGPKPKKVQPEHCHGIGCATETCDLCQTHGNALDPELPNEKFIGQDEIVFKALRDLSM